MHSVFRIEKKFSAKALSYGFPRLDMDGVMPYDCVRRKYACEVYWNPWSLWSCKSTVTFSFFWQPWAYSEQGVYSALCRSRKQRYCCRTGHGWWTSTESPALFWYTKYPLPTSDSADLRGNPCLADLDICADSSRNAGISFSWRQKADCISASHAELS